MGSLAKAAQLEKNARLAANTDADFLHVFLLTYRTFLTPGDLMDALVERFSMPDVDVSLDKMEVLCVVNPFLFSFFCVCVHICMQSDNGAEQATLSSLNRSTRGKVLGVLLEWISSHWSDFVVHPVLETKLAELFDLVNGCLWGVFVLQVVVWCCCFVVVVDFLLMWPFVHRRLRPGTLSLSRSVATV
jgi:hypothetical protein